MRKVTTGYSLDWIRAALAIVGAHPVEFLTMGLIMAVISLIPLLGMLTLLFLGPALLGGIIYAARESDRKHKPEVGHLFRAFQEGERIGSYVALCLPLFGAILLLVFFAIPLVGYAMHLGLITDKMASDPEAMRQALGQILFHSGGGFLYVVLAIVVIFIAGMATFLATPGIMLGHKPAFTAMKLSFLGCARNLGAFVVTTLLFGVPIQILAHVLDLLLPAMLASALSMVPYYAIVGPLAYCMYRDIFGDGQDAPADRENAAAPSAHTFEA